MSKSEAVKALAKVMIAAAWADGKIDIDEINSLKDLLFQLPEMTAADWAELEIYIDSPVSEGERARLVVELRDAISSPSDKAQAFEALEMVVEADGKVTDSEQVVITEIEDSLQKADISLFGQMGRMLRGPVSRRSQAMVDAPNREMYIDDFVKNKVFYNVRLRMDEDNLDVGIPEPELRKLSLAGGLMARVAYVDREIGEGEIDTMVSAIKENWCITQSEAVLVAEVAVSEISKKLDYYRLSREFFKSTTEEERVHFMDVLFAVADGDGRVSYEEIEEIRTIATVLKLTHKQFIDAKLKIPRDRRAN